jgi:sugar/nucleoside kinase (ribokinase family)
MRYICTGGRGRDNQPQGRVPVDGDAAGGGWTRRACSSQLSNSMVSVCAAGQGVLVAGPWFADLIFRGLSQPSSPGAEVFAEEFSLLPGGAFTLAMALHRLGHDVVWATDFGDDLFSRHILSLARAEGLNEIGFRHHHVPLRNLTVVFSYPDDRAMTTYRDPVSPLPLEILLKQHRPRMLLLPSLRYDRGTQAALRLAHKLGTEVFMDCQDIPGCLKNPLLRDTLAQVDFFAPNASEAMRLTGTTTVDDAIAALADLVGTVLIKRGSAGVTAVAQGQRYDLASIPVTAVDTTGAGDCFNAGFIHARLAGHDFPDCLAAGIACGAAAVTGLGCSAALTLAQLQQWLSRVPHRSRNGAKCSPV